MNRRTGSATAGLVVPALMALGMSADTSFRFLGDALGITNTWERGLLCGVAEAAIVALSLYSWATRSRGPAILAYAAVLAQAIPAFAVSGGTGGPVRVVLGPVLLAVMLHLLLGLEVRMSGTRPDSLWRATWREFKERLTAWLGIGRRGTDSAAIARSRAADRAVALADLVAAAKPGSRRYRRRSAALAAAIDAARHGLDLEDATTAETVIVGRIVRRKSVGDLAGIDLRHDWTASASVSSETDAESRTVLSLDGRERPAFRPVPKVVPTGVSLLPVVARPEAAAQSEPRAEVVIPTYDMRVPDWTVKDQYWKGDPVLGMSVSVAADTVRQVVTEVVALTPNELLKRAFKLNRDLVRSTNRPVTIDRLREEFGLSRREATALRRLVVMPNGGERS